MPNPEYQRLLRRTPDELGAHLADSAPNTRAVAQLIADLSDEEVAAAFRDLGGHSVEALDEAFGAIDDTRPTVVLAYTIKGTGCPTKATRRTIPRC